ncbi:MAG: aminomethyl-transferring glycine dehydrogenase subunit GcvPA [Spirochaetaceae bacterium]|nr:aminomethyl-transferring glycine dehydrogenase subunit GcvPA [Spirochaetaceae bacterium]
MPFIPNTDADRKAMLSTIGVDSVEELFSDIPEKRRFPELKLPEGLSEPELLKELEKMSAKNLTADRAAWFLGAGAYNHFVPSVVPALASRGEFLTAYTPYQPEVSQGTLQSIFEYQSMAAELLGMAVVNASHYDGATALAEAIIMALKNDPGRTEILLPCDMHPEFKEVVATYLAAHQAVINEYSGSPSTAPVSSKTACLVASYPTFSGEIYPLEDGARLAHDAGALFIVQADPLLCAILKSPGAQGADIVTAEGQCLGNSMNFGGPYLGMMGATATFMRKIPGRIVGETKDKEGKRGYVLTLSAREQHIRREKAVSNICSNQGLVMLQACIYMAAMGKNGMKTVAGLCHDKAHYAAEQIGLIPGYKIRTRTFFKEFLVSTPVPAETIFDRLAKRKVVPGLPLSRYDAARPNELLVCVTEMNTRAEIDSLVQLLKEVAQ